MRSSIFVVSAERVRGRALKEVWFAQSIRNYATADDSLRVSISETSGLDSAALYKGEERVAVVHFLGNYDSDGRRLRFGVVDLTPENKLIEATREFSQANEDMLTEIS